MSGSEDGVVMLWDFRKKGNARQLEGHTGLIDSVISLFMECRVECFLVTQLCFVSVLVIDLNVKSC